MKKAIDEFNTARKDYINDDGVIFKGVVNEKAYDTETRGARFVMSAESPDLMLDVVKQEGIDLANFMKNPVALAFHNHRAPIGLWKDVEVVSGRPKRLEGTVTLHAEGTTAATDEISNLLSVGGLKAVSIGFIPKEVEFIRDADGAWTGGFVIPESILLECSIVSVPAQPVALMKDAGGDHKLLAETLEFILDTYCEKTTGGLYVRKEFEDAYLAIKETKKASTNTLNDNIELKFDVDTTEIDGFFARFKKELGELFAGKQKEADVENPFAEYLKGSIHFTRTESDDGSVDISADKWPEKMAIAMELAEDEGSHVDVDDGVFTIATSKEIAKYKSVGVSEADNGIHYVDLIEVTPIEPKEPVLVAGSRAKAMAKLTLIKSGLVQS